MAYPFNSIEPKWQKYWEKNNINKISDDFNKPKYYVLDMFPYPSGAGLHIGHPEGYTATDILARYKKMKGYNVLHPMGFDAFGLPTERYSMTTGIHPAIATEKNIENFKKQLKMLGLGYDWSREINTTLPDYVKWTQWMFLLIYNSWFDTSLNKARHIDELPIPSVLKTVQEIEEYKDTQRLAYIAMVPVNWCEELGTVLANEEVEEWKSKGYTVERKPMRQWMLRITAYAERLLNDLQIVDWPNSTREMQIHWIGKSIGAEVDFKTEKGHTIRVFTTRPDTLFGATYMVLAPEHPLTLELTTQAHLEEVQNYIKETLTKSDLERSDLSKEKTGIFTGSYAINPVNNEKIPIWLADYVLAQYGTGAIMSVPGHDERDYEFAKKFNLSIKQVVKPLNNDWDITQAAYTEKDGIGCNSANDEISLNDVPTPHAIEKMNKWLEEKRIGKMQIQYKLRDWLFSRQRYWGEPIPIMFFEDGSKRALTTEELPLELPEVKDFMPAGTGESPLAKVEKWINFIDPKTGKKAKFETNTMPQWAGSCWYYLRYIDPHNTNSFCDAEKEKYWMQPNGIDLYVGGAEHAVLHLLYARFWHKLLYDYAYVSTSEPFKKLFHQGLILGEDGEKMSKSRGNVVNPDDIVTEWGADSLRLYLMFLGPLEASKPWKQEGISGVFNFLNRAWRLISDEEGNMNSSVCDCTMSKEQEYALHSMIKGVAADIEALSFNTAISKMMIFVNEFTKAEQKNIDAMNKFVICLAPFAPHIAEELWSILGNSDTVFKEKYPEYDESKLIKDEIEYVIQINSKIRAKLQCSPDLSQDALFEIAKQDTKIQQYLTDVNIVKVIYVPNKLMNLIVK